MIKKNLCFNNYHQHHTHKHTHTYTLSPMHSYITDAGLTSILLSSLSWEVMKIVLAQIQSSLLNDCHSTIRTMMHANMKIKDFSSDFSSFKTSNVISRMAFQYLNAMNGITLIKYSCILFYMYRDMACMFVCVLCVPDISSHDIHHNLSHPNISAALLCLIRSISASQSFTDVSRVCFCYYYRYCYALSSEKR